MRAFLAIGSLALAMGATGPAVGDEVGSDPFEGLIPGERIPPDELEELLGRGVNDRGSLRVNSTQSESSSFFSETTESSRSSSYSSSSSAGAASQAGAATYSAGGIVGGPSRISTSPGAASSSGVPTVPSVSGDYRSPSGNVLRSPSVMRTTTVGGRF